MALPPPNHDCVTQVVTQDFLPENAVRYLTKRGKTYYFRVRIPFHIAKYFPSLANDEDFVRADMFNHLAKYQKS